MNKNPHIKLSDYQALAEFRYQMRRLPALQRAGRPRTPASSRNSINSCWPSKAIPDGEEPRIAYLAERLQIQHHSAVELVDRMEKKGLITSDPRRKRPARGPRAAHGAGRPRADGVDQAHASRVTLWLRRRWWRHCAN